MVTPARAGTSIRTRPLPAEAFTDEATYLQTRLPVDLAATLIPDAYTSGEFFGLEEPAMRVGRPSLSLVDVAEQEQRLRFGFGTAQLGGLLRDLEQLVRGFLELAELHRDVRSPHA